MSDETKSAVNLCVDRLKLFGPLSVLSSSDLRLLAEFAELKEFDAGTNMITEGSESSEFYIIEECQAEAITWSNNGDEVVLSLMREGDVFGELGVLNNEKRSATVVAETKGLVLVISKVDLMKIAEAPAGFVETLQETMNLYSPVETRVVGSAEDSLGEKMTDTELQELYDGLIEKGGLTELV